MADIRISQFPIASQLVGNEILPFIQTGINVRATVSDVLSLFSATLIYDNFLDLPPVGSQKLIYVVRDTASLYYWTGTVYEALSTAVPVPEILSFPTLVDFPTVGKINTIYIDNSTFFLYVWDNVALVYQQVGGAGGTSTSGVSSHATFSAFPVIGQVGIIYIAEDNNVTFRWNALTSTYNRLNQAPTEIQTFSSLTTFPATGQNGVLYIAADTSEIYRWATPAYRILSKELQRVRSVANFISLPLVGTTEVIYITTDTNRLYRWNGSGYSELSQDVQRIFQFPTLANFPTIGQVNILYLTINTNLIYRWNGINYTQLSASASTFNHFATRLAFPLVGLSTSLYLARDTQILYWWNGTDYIEVSEDVIQVDRDQDKPLLGQEGKIYVVRDTNALYRWDLSFNRYVAVGGVSEISDNTGFIDRSQSTISFNQATRVFTIAPTLVEYFVYFQGIRATKTGSLSVTIPNTTQTTYIYFDRITQNLTTQVGYSKALLEDHATIAMVVWNSIQGQATLFVDQRYGPRIGGSTHLYLYEVLGTVWEGGLGLLNIDADQPGDSDLHAQFGIEGGTIKNGENSFSIVDGIPQDISPIVVIPMFYRKGNVWYKTTPSDLPVLYSGNVTDLSTATRIGYNEEISTDNYVVTEATEGRFVFTHVFAIPDTRHPIIGVVGSGQYLDAQLAIDAAQSEFIKLKDKFFKDAVAIATVIYQTSSSYTNTVKARIRRTSTGGDYIDWRDSRSFSGLSQISAGQEIIRVDTLIDLNSLVVRDSAKLYIVSENKTSYTTNGVDFFKLNADIEQYPDLIALNALGPIEKKTDKLYVTTDNERVYYWNGLNFIQVSAGLGFDTYLPTLADLNALPLEQKQDQILYLTKDTNFVYRYDTLSNSFVRLGKDYLDQTVVYVDGSAITTYQISFLNKAYLFGTTTTLTTIELPEPTALEEGTVVKLSNYDNKLLEIHNHLGKIDVLLPYVVTSDPLSVPTKTFYCILIAGVYQWISLDTTFNDFIIATDLLDGQKGLVPKPTILDIGKFLSADQSWSFVPNFESFTTQALFPVLGRDKTFYVDLETNLVYRFDTTLSTYVEVGRPQLDLDTVVVDVGTNTSVSITQTNRAYLFVNAQQNFTVTIPLAASNLTKNSYQILNGSLFELTVNDGSVVCILPEYTTNTQPNIYPSVTLHCQETTPASGVYRWFGRALQLDVFKSNTDLLDGYKGLVPAPLADPDLIDKVLYSDATWKKPIIIRRAANLAALPPIGDVDFLYVTEDDNVPYRYDTLTAQYVTLAKPPVSKTPIAIDGSIITTHNPTANLRYYYYGTTTLTTIELPLADATRLEEVYYLSNKGNSNLLVVDSGASVITTLPYSLDVTEVSVVPSVSIYCMEIPTGSNNYIWVALESTLDTFVGSTALANGQKGLVPKPLTTDLDYVLSSSGIWTKRKQVMRFLDTTQFPVMGDVEYIYLARNNLGGVADTNTNVFYIWDDVTGVYRKVNDTYQEYTDLAEINALASTERLSNKLYLAKDTNLIYRYDILSGLFVSINSVSDTSVKPYDVTREWKVGEIAQFYGLLITPVGDIPANTPFNWGLTGESWKPLIEATAVWKGVFDSANDYTLNDYVAFTATDYRLHKAHVAQVAPSVSGARFFSVVNPNQSEHNLFVGATETLNGTKGDVPAPGVSDLGKYLKGNGQWADLIHSSTTFATLPSPGLSGTIYRTSDNQKLYIWESGQYVSISTDYREASDLATLIALPADEKIVSKLYLTIDTNIIYRFDGTSFVAITTPPTAGAGIVQYSPNTEYEVGDVVVYFGLLVTPNASIATTDTFAWGTTGPTFRPMLSSTLTWVGQFNTANNYTAGQVVFVNNQDPAVFIAIEPQTAPSVINLRFFSPVSLLQTFDRSFVGATNLLAGTSGDVPSPTIANREMFLKGDGSWSDVLFVSPTTAGFPVTGESSTTYIASSSNDAYWWNGVSYQPLANSYITSASLTVLNTIPLANRSTSKFYVTLDDNQVYRFNGTDYILVSPSISGSGVREYDQSLAWADGDVAVYYGIVVQAIGPISAGTPFSWGTVNGTWKPLMGQAFTWLGVFNSANNYTAGEIIVANTTNPVIYQAIQNQTAPSVRNSRFFSTITSVQLFHDTFLGANGLTNGVKGDVPAPVAASGDQYKFLKGDGSWSDLIESYNTFTTLPSPGTTTTIYRTRDDGQLYLWDSVGMVYEAIGGAGSSSGSGVAEYDQTLMWDIDQVASYYGLLVTPNSPIAANTPFSWGTAGATWRPLINKAFTWRGLFDSANSYNNGDLVVKDLINPAISVAIQNQTAPSVMNPRFFTTLTLLQLLMDTYVGSTDTLSGIKGLVPAATMVDQFASLRGNGTWVNNHFIAINKANFPATGEANIIYLATNTNDTYYWNGTAYIPLETSYLTALTLGGLELIPLVDRSTAKLYVTLDTNTIYRWNGTDYIPIVSGSSDKSIREYNQVLDWQAGDVAVYFGLVVQANNSIAGGTPFSWGDSGSTWKPLLNADFIWRGLFNPTSNYQYGDIVVASNQDPVVYLAIVPQTAPSERRPGLFTAITVTQLLQDSFVGATDTRAGVKGDVPAPTIANRFAFLRGDGLWTDLFREFVDIVSFPTVGEPNLFYRDTTANITYYWNGIEYKSIGSANGSTVFTSSDTEPLSPNPGDIWYDRISEVVYIRVSDINGTFWLDISTILSGGGTGTVKYNGSPTPPPTPSAGDIWYDNVNEIVFIRIDDGGSSYWLDISTVIASNITVQGSIVGNESNNSDPPTVQAVFEYISNLQHFRYSNTETTTNEVWVDNRLIFRQAIDCQALNNGASLLPAGFADKLIDVFAQASDGTFIHPISNDFKAIQNIATKEIVLVRTGAFATPRAGDYIVLSYTKV